MSLNASLRDIADRQATDWLISLRETEDEAVFESLSAASGGCGLACAAL